MKRRAAPLLACAGVAMAGAWGEAGAQEWPAEQAIAFTLKPRHGPALGVHPGPGPRALRLTPIAPVDVDDRGQDLAVAIERRTVSLARPLMLDPAAPDFSPRSRVTRYSVESHVPVGDAMRLSLGWHGIKIANRNANVTAGASGNRLRTRDYFLPSAALTMQPADAVRLTIDYVESLRAYGGTGVEGAMGLTRDAFEALRRTLKPETQSRSRISANWAATPVLDLTLALQTGRLDDRLTFTRGGMMPVNGGSARVDGAVLTALHRISRHLAWSLRYREAQIRESASPDMRERSLMAAAEWQEGPLRLTASLARASRPALATMPARAVRVEAGVDYAITRLMQRPMQLSLRLTDPDGLAITRFAADDLSGPVRAADQARALMAGARFAW